MHAQLLSRVQLFVTPWTVACQAPLSMGFPQARENTGVGCHFLLQGIISTQGLKPPLLHWQANSLPMSHLGSPCIVLTPKVKLKFSVEYKS